MEEEGDRVKFIAGGIIILLIVGFFVVRGFLSKKSQQQTASVPSIVKSVTPTPYGGVKNQPTVSPTPLPYKTPATLSSAGSAGAPNYYYQSQSSANYQGNQSQSQSNGSQSQSQTLPNGMTQSQSQ